MLFNRHGILQFISQSGFHSTVLFFFFFTVHCYFMAILKTSADTNAGQSHRLTHCIKNLHCYNLRVRFYGKIQKRIIDPRSLASRCIKGTDKSTPRKDSSVPLMHRDPSDHGSMIRSRIFPKKCTLKSLTLKHSLLFIHTIKNTTQLLKTFFL